MILGAVGSVGARGRLIEPVQRVMREIALGAAALAAQQAHGFELRKQIVARSVDMQHPVHDAPGGVLPRRHQRGGLGGEGGVVGEPDRGDPGCEQRLVGDALHRSPVHEHARPEAAERFPVIRGGHQH